LAAWFTQLTFKLTLDERRILFGLSNSQAAATLAAVLVGYNIVLGVSETGKPIRLLEESVLNGTILMILVTCTIASFVTQKGAKNIALLEEEQEQETGTEELEEKILIPINNVEYAEELVNLSITIKSKKNKNGLFALNIIDDTNEGGTAQKTARKILDKASNIAASTDNKVHELLRHDLNVVNGISNVVKEQKITDLILGLHKKKGISDSFLGNLIEGILTKCNVTTLIYKPFQPLATIKRHIVVLPERAEKEEGFPFWLLKIWNIARNTGAKLIFHGAYETLQDIKEIHAKHPIEADFVEFSDWNDFLIIARDVKKDDNLVIILSRREGISFNYNMNKIPNYLNKYFKSNNYMIIYPMQFGVGAGSKIDLKNPSVFEPLKNNLDKIFNLFRKK
jgi:nucleotide-binding universal stress UspA family protein